MLHLARWLVLPLVARALLLRRLLLHLSRPRVLSSRCALPAAGENGAWSCSCPPSRSWSPHLPPWKLTRVPLARPLVVASSLPSSLPPPPPLLHCLPRAPPPPTTPPCYSLARPLRPRKLQPIRHFVVIGRKEPSETEPNPQLYKLQVFAEDEVVARSRFWYVLHQSRKMKKTTGQILSVNEVHERNPTVVKNFAIWIRYNSRSGTHNMYKEFRDTTLCGAMKQMYDDMAGRHRARKSNIQVLKYAVVKPSEVRRAPIKQMIDGTIKFPLTHVLPRAPSRRFKSTFVARRPSTFRG